MTDSAPAPAPAPAPAGASTNVLAIIALIGAFVLAPVGIIVGHIALSQIKKTGENGRGLALAGTVIGYVFTAIWLLAIALGTIIPLLVLGTAVQNY